MTAWRALREEVAVWRAQGLTLPLWWRDDDAVADTDALGRLSAMAGRHDLPVHLAVIPDRAEASLARAVARDEALVPMVHGWAHRNHAAPGDKKAEFGAHRGIETLTGDAGRGLSRLTDLFADRLAPVFVPPWNRIAPGLPDHLARLGFHGLSTFGPRATAQAAPGLWQVNTHIDPIDWKGTRGLVATGLLLPQIVRLLQDRRLGRTDAAEPLGLLTHHLVHDADVWAFCDDLLSLLGDLSWHRWTPARHGCAG